MIKITRLNGSVLYVNPHQIEFMEKTPDTIISMVSGRKAIAKESIDEIIDRITQYRSRIVNESTLTPSFYGNEE